MKKTIILSYALAVFGLLLCPAVADTAQEMVDKAMTAIKSNDTDTALALIKAADDQGYHAEVQFIIGCYWHHQNQAAKAVERWTNAAELGYAPAQFELGGCYLYGNGVTKDTKEAIKWIRKAAEQGLSPAQYILGLCYEKGEGVPQDNREAVKWLRKAADQGLEQAKEALFRCYVNGYGVE